MKYSARLMFLAMLVGSSWAGRAHIELESQASIAPGRIHLGDIALIEGDANLVEDLKNLEVGRMDLPGRETKVSSNALKGFYLRAICPLESLTVDGSAFVRVRTRSSQVDADSLRQLLLGAVGPRMEGIIGRDWALETPRLPAKIQVPEGEFQWSVELSARFDGRGDETANIRVLSNGKTVTQMTIPFLVRRWGSVVRTTEMIQRGQPVQPNQVALERVELTRLNRVFANRLDDVIGRTALRTIARDQDMVDSWLERPYAVHEGDQVRLQVLIGSAMVSAVGVALRSAYQGQRIEVENLDTHKRLQGMVDGPGEVRVVD